MVYGVWCMVYLSGKILGRSSLMEVQNYAVVCMVYGVWCMVYGVWCMVHSSIREEKTKGNLIHLLVCIHPMYTPDVYT